MWLVQGEHLSGVPREEFEVRTDICAARAELAKAAESPADNVAEDITEDVEASFPRWLSGKKVGRGRILFNTAWLLLLSLMSLPLLLLSLLLRTNGSFSLDAGQHSR